MKVARTVQYLDFSLIPEACFHYTAQPTVCIDVKILHMHNPLLQALGVSLAMFLRTARLAALGETQFLPCVFSVEWMESTLPMQRAFM